MEIVIHGTKGGRQIFTPKKVSGLLDVTPDTVKGSPVGQEAYAIRLVEDNCILSKYKIVRDVRGDKRIGFVGFSVFLPHYLKMDGKDAISLLDQVSYEYCEKYVVENNLNDVKEEWAFLESIMQGYHSKIRRIASDEVESPQSGSGEAAFIYYSDRNALENYLDSPYQEEYSQYRQVFFIKSEFQDKAENPLNALRHSGEDLTLKIDLSNPLYRLRIHDNLVYGLCTSVKADGTARYNWDRIRLRSDIVVTWSRPHYEKVEKKASYLMETQVGDAIFFDHQARQIIVKEISLLPTKKTIPLAWKSRNISLLGSLEVKIGDRDWERQDILVFSGEDIARPCSVSLRSGDAYFSDPISFVPNDKNELDVIMHERKRIGVEVIEDNLVLGNTELLKCQIERTGEQIETAGNYMIFVDEQIDRTHLINVSVLINSNRRQGTATVDPRNDQIVRVHLEALKAVEATEANFGSFQSGQPTCDPEHLDIAGQRSLTSSGNASSQGRSLNGRSGKETSRRKKKAMPSWFIAALILIICIPVIVFVTWKVRIGSKPDPEGWPELTEVEVKAYLDGTELLQRALENLKSRWNAQRAENTSQSGSDGWNPIRQLLDPEQEKNSEAENQGDEIARLIETGLKMRGLVDKLDFPSLLHQTYSSQQFGFKTSIEKIEPADYGEMKAKLGNVDNFRLDQIAFKIDSINKMIAQGKRELAGEEPAATERVGNSPSNNRPHEVAGNKRSPEEPQSPNLKLNEQVAAKKESVETKSHDNTANIIEYIKGDELKREKLRLFLTDKETSTTLKKSIQLCVDFWSLDGSGKGRKAKTYYTLLGKVKGDVNLQNSALLNFLSEMADPRRPEPPRYPNELPGIESTTNTLKAVKDKLTQ